MRDGGCAEFGFAGGQGIDQARLQRLRGRHTFSRAHHGDRARHAHDARQPLCAARAGDDAQRDLWQSDHGAGRGHAGVAAQCQLKATAQRRTMQRRHKGLGAGLDGGDHIGQLRLCQGLAEFAQV